jgi:DNA ligase-1
MTVDEFKNREDPKTIHDVSINLEKWAVNGYENSKIKFSKFYLVRNMDEVDALFKKVRNKGGEGLMLKLPDAKYEWKRSKTWIKLKAVYSTTLKVVDTYMAGDTTKYKGLVGGIICETLDGHRFSVGSGLTDTDRVAFTDPSNIVGKLVEVAFTDVNYTEDGELFLDFPRYKGVRFDKDEPDTSEQAFAEVPTYKMRKD